MPVGMRRTTTALACVALALGGAACGENQDTQSEERPEPNSVSGEGAADRPSSEGPVAPTDGDREED